MKLVKSSAGLPEGSPAGKGNTLDQSVPGYKTFSKPDHEPARTPEYKDESIYEVSGPDSLGKKQTVPDTVDKSDESYGYYGLGPTDEYSAKPKYPYRDNKPNQHNASVVDIEFVAEWHRLSTVVPRTFPYSKAKIAATIEKILSGLNPKFKQRATTVAVTLKRANPAKLRWIFSVKGEHLYVVKVKGIRPRSNTTKLSKMDLELACTCPAWQWQGPEYHSTTTEYQLGPLQGTASTPDIRDPERQNFVCKHVAAVLEHCKNWEIPVKRK